MSTYRLLWRNKWLTADAKTIEEMVGTLYAAADALQEMERAGVQLSDDGSVADDYACLVTEDPAIAERFGFEEEEGEDEEGDDGGTADHVVERGKGTGHDA